MPPAIPETAPPVETDASERLEDTHAPPDAVSASEVTLPTQTLVVPVMGAVIGTPTPIDDVL
jgi:hypothetical protein